MDEALKRKDVEDLPGLIQGKVHEVTSDASMRQESEGKFLHTLPLLFAKSILFLVSWGSQ